MSPEVQPPQNFSTFISRHLIGSFDAVYDRGALCSVNISDRPRYIRLIKEVCEDGATMMVCTPQFDRVKHPGQLSYFHIFHMISAFLLYEKTLMRQKMFCIYDLLYISLFTFEKKFTFHLILSTEETFVEDFPVILKRMFQNYRKFSNKGVLVAGYYHNNSFPNG